MYNKMQRKFAMNLFYKVIYALTLLLLSISFTKKIRGIRPHLFVEIFFCIVCLETLHLLFCIHHIHMLKAKLCRC